MVDSAAGRAGRTGGPLSGLLVADFSRVLAGPYATMLLADLGAEVIKVESRTHPDNLRLSGPHQPGAKPLEGSGYFASRNTSKKSIALNMSHPQARQIALTLASRCSIVSNNFRPGVMEKWGLGYGEVAAVNPSVIYLAMPMQGSSGPNRDYIGFGSTIAALCRLVAMAGRPGRPPLGTGTHYPDHVPNPGHALVAVLAAAFHRAHQSRYGYAQPKNVVEIVSARVRSIGVIEKLKIQRFTRSSSKAIAKPHNFVETYFERKRIRAAVYRREELLAGSRLRTPCIVTEYSATTLIPEGASVNVDHHGNLIVQV